MAATPESPLIGSLGNLTLDDEDGEEEDETSEEELDENVLDGYMTNDRRIHPDIVEGIQSMDRNTRLDATVKIRRLLQSERWSPAVVVQPVLDSGLLPEIIKMLSSDDHEFLWESTWIVVNITAGSSEQTSTVVQAGVIPKLVTLFRTSPDNVRINILMAIGNVLGDSEHLRQVAIREGGFELALDVLRDPDNHSPSCVDSAAWTMTSATTSNYGGLPDDDLAARTVLVLATFIHNHGDDISESLVEAVTALRQLSIHRNVTAVVKQCGINSQIFRLFTAENDRLREAALYLVVNMSRESDASLQEMMDAGCLGALDSCISEYPRNSGTASLVVANIARGTSSQVRTLVESTLLPRILQVPSESAEFLRCRIQAAEIVVAVTRTAASNPTLLDSMVNAGYLEGLSNGLLSSHSTMLGIHLQAIEQILNAKWDGRQRLLERFDVSDGPRRLRDLRLRAKTSCCRQPTLFSRGGRCKSKRALHGSQILTWHAIRHVLDAGGSAWHGTSKKLYPASGIQRSVFPTIDVESRPNETKYSPDTDMSTKTEDAVMDTAEKYSDKEESDVEEIDQAVLDGFTTEDERIAPEIIEGLRSKERNARLGAVTKLRQLAYYREAVGIQTILDSGLFQAIINMMTSDDAGIKNQTSQTVVAITSGTSEQVSALVAVGAIPTLINLVSSTDSDDLRDDALAALANIGGKSQNLRENLFRDGGLKPPLDVLANPSQYPETTTQFAVQAISNYLSPIGGKTLGYEMTKQIIPALCKYIVYQADETDVALEDSLLFLKQLLVAEPQIDDALKTDVIPRLIHLCASKETDTRSNALLCVSQIIRFSVPGTDALINAGILDTFKTCMTSGDPEDRKVACFAASNLVVESLSHAKALVDSGLVPLLVKVLMNQEEVAAARNDAAWTLSSLACNWGQNHHEMLDVLFETNSLEAFCTALTLKDYNAVEVSLKGITVFVNTQWSGRQNAVERMKVGDGIERVRVVRFRNDIYRTELHKMAQTILKNHFPQFSMPVRM